MTVKRTLPKPIILVQVAIFLIIISDNLVLKAQVVNEPINSSVYNYLNKISNKGIIDFDDLIIPVSRKYIAGKLLEIKNNLNNLTGLEKAELKFYLKDYYFEINPNQKRKEEFQFFKKDAGDRFRFFSYSSNRFRLNLDPIIGFKLGLNDNKFVIHRWSGVYFYGYLTDRIGFKFSFRDNAESGLSIDRTKNFTPETGVIINNSSTNSIEYSEFRTNIGTDWSWGSFSLGKDFLEWGYGESGKIVLSNKAPSFPYLRLDLTLTPWLKFNYFLVKLSSDVVDSLATYKSKISDPSFDRSITREKYMASHTIKLKLAKSLNIALGESIIFSDRFEWSYLFPLMFFKAADHYLSRYDNSKGDNSQFFLSVSSRNWIKNTHIWGTLFIDEITLEGLFNKEKQRNQLGFTLGNSVTDFPVPNLTFKIEYTRILPFVYNNFIQTQTYENHSYLMGHWIGNNADMIYGSIKYWFLRGLQTKIWAYYIRKGEAGTPLQQYSNPQPSFLFGSNKYYNKIGFELKYEIMHNFFVNAEYEYSSTKESGNKDEIDHKNNIYVSFYYGI